MARERIKKNETHIKPQKQPASHTQFPYQGSNSSAFAQIGSDSSRSQQRYTSGSNSSAFGQYGSGSGAQQNCPSGSTAAAFGQYGQRFPSSSNALQRFPSASEPPSRYATPSEGIQRYPPPAFSGNRNLDSAYKRGEPVKRKQHYDEEEDEADENDPGAGMFKTAKEQLVCLVDLL